MASKIEFYRENTVNINLTFSEIDLTGATIYFTVKQASDETSDDSTALIKKDITSHTNPTNGTTLVQLTPSDTDVAPGKYVYDIKLKKANGDQTTVQVGNVVVKPAVTNRG